MAHVLTDWSKWLGIKPVKMGRITLATKALWALIGFVLLISLLEDVLIFGRPGIAELVFMEIKGDWLLSGSGSCQR